jgi:hypothetical protein
MWSYLQSRVDICVIPTLTGFKSKQGRAQDDQHTPEAW